MKIFEEQFPSLKDREVASIGTFPIYRFDTIQEACLDKQRVLDALDTGRSPICTKCSNCIKEELGLK